MLPPKKDSIATISFRPSDVRVFGSYPPFVGTFNKTEREIGAAYLVIALAVCGDQWRSIAWSEICTVIKDAVERDKEAQKTASPDETEDAFDRRAADNMIHSLATNPFAMPDFHGLVKDGFACWMGEPGKSELELTNAGLERLLKWVVPSSSRNPT